ncbi:MAG: hypothetical protein GY918_07580 [Gammaproteobacteria bacterium]|nr:hypothetical protein [Gammaproteobacteria bacterium]
MAHYIQHINTWGRDNGVMLGEHFAPHDIEVRELTSGKSRRDTAREMGINFRVVKQHKVLDGIEAARRLFSSIWIDERRCQYALECLSQYRFEYDDKKGVFKNQPVHDWSSHCADAFRQIAMGWSDRLKAPQQDSMTVVPQGAMTW